MSELLTALDRSTACERIAQTLYETVEATTLPWDCAPMTVREEYRARAREAIRSCLSYAVDAAREAVARSLALADNFTSEDIGPTQKARYRHRAIEAASRYRWHLAESAYPEDIERQIGAMHTTGRTLGEMVQETRARALTVVR